MLLRERNNFQPIATSHAHIIPTAQHNSLEKKPPFSNATSKLCCL